MVAPALATLAGTMMWTGEFDEGERWPERTRRALQTESGAGHRAARARCPRDAPGRPRPPPAGAGGVRRGRTDAWQLGGSHALISQVTGWTLATQARLGMADQARAALAALDERAGQLRRDPERRRGDPPRRRRPGRSPRRGAGGPRRPRTRHRLRHGRRGHLLAALAHRELGDQRAANQAAERSLALAEPDGLVLPFAMTGSQRTDRGSAAA